MRRLAGYPLIRTKLVPQVNGEFVPKWKYRYHYYCISLTMFLDGLHEKKQYYYWSSWTLSQIFVICFVCVFIDIQSWSSECQLSSFLFCWLSCPAGLSYLFIFSFLHLLPDIFPLILTVHYLTGQSFVVSSCSALLLFCACCSLCYHDVPLCFCCFHFKNRSH